MRTFIAIAFFATLALAVVLPALAHDPCACDNGPEYMHSKSSDKASQSTKSGASQSKVDEKYRKDGVTIQQGCDSSDNNYAKNNAASSSKQLELKNKDGSSVSSRSNKQSTSSVDLQNHADSQYLTINSDQGC